jgi:multidrug resistance efflux pump
MEILLLGIYSVVVWLVFFKFKWLPWNIVSQVIVITLPVIGITVLILLLNIVAPSSHDVRVINYVVQIVPRVTGRVIEVPVEPNRPVHKGDVLFRIDPTPFELQVGVLEARVPELQAKLTSAQAYQRELEEELQSARGKKEAVAARLELARLRVRQTQELAEAGAGPRFDFEQAEAEVRNLEAELAAGAAAESQVVQRLSARTDAGELSEVAQALAALAQLESQLATARWELEQTTVTAPADGTVVNLQLREGSYAAALPLRPVMSFVENEQWVIALFAQNELRAIEPGNEAEIALKTYPNRIIKCVVDSIVWASGTGQLPLGGTIPETGPEGAHIEPGRFAVRLMPHGADEELFLAAGAQGQGAVYTDSGHAIHILRKVILRVGTKMDWLILKLH